MLFSIGLLMVIFFVAYRAAPQEKKASALDHGAGNLVEWQSSRIQEYRNKLMIAVARFWELFGVRRLMRFELPVAAGEYESASANKRQKQWVPKRGNKSRMKKPETSRV
jgi:hypothetical protein